jgi:hypothetical protein
MIVMPVGEGDLGPEKAAPAGRHGCGWRQRQQQIDSRIGQKAPIAASLPGVPNAQGAALRQPGSNPAGSGSAEVVGSSAWAKPAWRSRL